MRNSGYDSVTDRVVVLGYFQGPLRGRYWRFFSVDAFMQGFDPYHLGPNMGTLGHILAKQSAEGRTPTSFDFIDKGIVVAEQEGPKSSLAFYSGDGRHIYDGVVTENGSTSLVRLAQDRIFLVYFDHKKGFDIYVGATKDWRGIKVRKSEPSLKRMVVRVDGNVPILLTNEGILLDPKAAHYNLPNTCTWIVLNPYSKPFIDLKRRLHNAFGSGENAYSVYSTEDGSLLHESAPPGLAFVKEVVALDGTLFVAGYESIVGGKPTDVRIKRVNIRE